ncbi:unnamed protein product [Strongylus vulgaris]|uniref:Uncharacterized protein n=1 Tax=Strongylus vulgaris TaxID=40348 RepID=A0A3P7IZW4_STRVU|nr:unnamed protein product [Strongylus vulgaris]
MPEAPPSGSFKSLGGTCLSEGQRPVVKAWQGPGKALHPCIRITSTASMSSRPVSGCTGLHGFRTERIRQRLAMETVSCSAPTTPGQFPPRPIFKRFSKLQGALTTT